MTPPAMAPVVVDFLDEAAPEVDDEVELEGVEPERVLFAEFG